MNGKYTAEGIARTLEAEGFGNITRRTVNYYAFEKKMFEVSATGKQCFGEAELEKLKAIRLLQEYTTLTLEQIKQLINEKPLAEIIGYCNARMCQQTSRNNVSNYTVLPGRAMPAAAPAVDTVVTASVAEGERVIRVSPEITLVIDGTVSRERLAAIVDFIKQKQ